MAIVTTSLDRATLRAELVAAGSPWLGVEHYRSIGSTNARAAALGQPWRVVTADHQSAGRGRLTRTWQAPPGTSVAVSATVPLRAPRQGWLPLVAGLAAAEAVETAAGVQADLKWPNDVLLPSDEGRKVCGILCEVVGVGSEALAVVGAGINVSQTRAQLPVDTATSLALAHATEADRNALVVAYLRRLAAWHGALGSDVPVAGSATTPDPTPRVPLAAAREAYRGRCSTLGRTVRLSRPDGADVVGTAVDVDDEGRLVIEAEGQRTAWAAGDVVHTRTGA